MMALRRGSCASLFSSCASLNLWWRHTVTSTMSTCVTVLPGPRRLISMSGDTCLYSVPSARVRVSIHSPPTRSAGTGTVSAVTCPNEENVVSVQKSDYSTHISSIASGGAVSFYDSRLETSALQKANAATGWQRDGFSCHPEPPFDNYFDVVWNFSECLGVINYPSRQTFREHSGSNW